MKGSTLWLIQRLSAVVMLLTWGYVTFFFIVHQPLSYALWSEFMHQLHIQILMTISLFAAVKHASVGLKSILTDYVKSLPIRSILFASIMMAVIVSTIYLLAALWGL